MKHRVRQALAVAIAAAAGLVASWQPAQAAVNGPVGYDISWPQCGTAQPSPPFGLAVIGVTGGHGFSHNSCLAQEFGWARQASLPLDFYLNTDYPKSVTPVPPQAEDGPWGHCGATNDNWCYGYNWGWNSVYDAYSYAQSQHVDAQVWWLDVETNNNWAPPGGGPYDVASNQKDIQGGIDALNSLHKTVGIYSGRNLWKQIVGSWAPAVPSWTAGASDVNDASTGCGQQWSFTSGPVWLVQYPTSQNGVAFDGDYACATQPGWESLTGIHLAPLDTSGHGAAAITVNDSWIAARPSTGTTFGDAQNWSSTPFYGSRATAFADLDGPGQPASAIAIRDQYIYVMKNSGGTFGAVQVWSSNVFYGNRDTTVADVEGTGRADAVAINDGSVWVMRNQPGGGFGAPELWSNTLFYGSRGTFLADMDGSGRASVVAVNDNSVWVMLSQLGGGFGAPQLWSQTPFYGNRGTFVAVVDNTHRASIVAINDNNIWVEPNTGGGFGSPAVWATGAFYSSWQYMADVDGSGRASALAVSGNAIWVKQNQGGSFGPPALWLSGNFYGTH